MDLNFTLTVEGRIQLYENEAKWYERLASEAKDDNSRKHWKDRANERWLMARELKGA